MTPKYQRTDNLYPRFESELKNKIQFKASSRMSNDAVLFKAFKFYDLYNNGNLSRIDFFKAIAKCGVVVDTHVQSILSRILMLFIDIMIQRTLAKLITETLLKNCYSAITHKRNPIKCQKAV